MRALRAALALFAVGLACGTQQPAPSHPAEPAKSSAPAPPQPLPSGSAARAPAPCISLTPELVLSGAEMLQCVLRGAEKLYVEGHWADPAGGFGLLLLGASDSYTTLASDGRRLWPLSEKLGLGDDTIQAVKLRAGPELVAYHMEGVERVYRVDNKRERLVLAGPGPLVRIDITDHLAHQDGFPAWELASAGYPALHQSGKKAAVIWVEDDGIGTAPNFHVDVIATSDNALVRRFDILSDREFRTAALGRDGVARERALIALAATVEQRMAQVNAEIEPGGWKPLQQCELPTPTEWEAAQGGLAQSGSCGELSYRYRRASVRLEKQGRSAEHQLAKLRPGKHPAGVTMLDALANVYSDEAQSLILMTVHYAAAGGGDGYGLPQRWQVVRAP